MIALHCLHTGADGQTMIDINPICGPVLLCSLQSALIYTFGNYKLIISYVGFQNLVFVLCRSIPFSWNEKCKRCTFLFLLTSLQDFFSFPLLSIIRFILFIWTQIRHFSNCSEDKSSNEYDQVYFIISDWQIIVVQFLL